MDAIVTITLMEGKKARSTINAAVALPDQVADLAESDPARMSEWVFNQALERISKGDELCPH